ncbi:unnamed protein product [Dibothriocephalus latus]|uniref:Uncharacterized protein n=1 Tax=Dibothriocephalus latus TaxID=60516 RepID=A0A3P7L843_DIBLA|nr:unnamed protein product [Dibothriocephalus latus]
MVELFPDIHAFCAHVSGLFVKEIKIRAIDQTSEEGSKLIAAYLEGGLSHFNADGNTSNDQECKTDYDSLPVGTLLLLSLEQLACGASLIECMAAASVPSTLAKCLYIFLDLPPSESSELSKSRLLFQRKFTGILQKICVSAFAAEELVQADALRHLFSASVDPCSSENACWRRNSCKILTTLAQNCLTPLVIQYIHDSSCIAECIENLRQMRLPKADGVETFTSLFHVLSESSRSSTQLLDDFHACGGYSTLTEYLLKYDESLRNIRAVDCLQATFLRARSALLCTALLECVKEIFERSPGNYFVLDKHHLISSITETIPSKPDCVQVSSSSR